MYKERWATTKFRSQSHVRHTCQWVQVRETRLTMRQVQRWNTFCYQRTRALLTTLPLSPLLPQSRTLALRHICTQVPIGPR